MRHAHNQVPSTREINGGNSDGDPPLPIPNREVKPVSADGTAIPSGRVGSRQLSESTQETECSLCLFGYRGAARPRKWYECHSCGTAANLQRAFSKLSALFFYAATYERYCSANSTSATGNLFYLKNSSIVFSGTSFRTTSLLESRR